MVACMPRLFAVVATVTAAIAIAPAYAQVLLVVDGTNNSVIREFDATTGASINANFITGLNVAYGLAVDDKLRLFVSNGGSGGPSGSVGLYDAVTGNPINAAWVTGLVYPGGLVTDSNDHLLVMNWPAPRKLSQVL